jgi:hypothetical protein
VLHHPVNWLAAVGRRLTARSAPAHERASYAACLNIRIDVSLVAGSWTRARLRRLSNADIFSAQHQARGVGETAT